MEQAGAKVNWDEKEDEEKDELDDASSVEDIDGLGVDFPDLDRYPDRVEMRLSIFDLHEMMVDGSIDLNPPYQRDEVWGLDKRKDFVRFLFENRVCSVIVLSRDVKGGMEGRPNVARCLDGKQRLTSIFQFMDGQFSFKHPKTGKHFWYKVNEQTHNRRVLPQERKEQFLRETISIHEYRGLTEPQERDRFQDLQLGTHLTVAERLQAMSTPCAKWIHQLRNEYLSKDSSLRTLINSYRGLDFRTIEQLASSIHYIEDRVFPKFDGDRRFLQDLSLPSDALKHDVRRVLDKMRHLASNRRFRRVFYGFPNCKTVAPIEFVLFGILIHYTTRRNCKDKVIADTLFTFRQKLRDNSDRQIRLNYDIWTFSWGLVDEILGTTRKPPQKPKTESTSDASQLSKTASSSRTTVKAKRVKAEADQPATPQGLQTAGAIVQAARARDQRAAARSERMAVASAHPAAELASSRSTVTETMPCRTPDGTSEGGLPHSRSKRAIPFVELITRKKARIAPDLENAGNAIGTDEFQEIGRGRGRRLSSTAVNKTSGASLNSSPPLTRSTTKEQETKTEF